MQPQEELTNDKAFTSEFYADAEAAYQVNEQAKLKADYFTLCDLKKSCEAKYKKVRGSREDLIFSFRMKAEETYPELKGQDLMPYLSALHAEHPLNVMWAQYSGPAKELEVVLIEIEEECWSICQQINETAAQITDNKPTLPMVETANMMTASDLTARTAVMTEQIVGTTPKQKIGIVAALGVLLYALLG